MEARGTCGAAGGRVGIARVAIRPAHGLRRDRNTPFLDVGHPADNHRSLGRVHGRGAQLVEFLSGARVRLAPHDMVHWPQRTKTLR